MTSLTGTRENSQGTVDRGAAGSSQYTGSHTFSDDSELALTYVFNVGSASFQWTRVGEADIFNEWKSLSREECPLPGK